MRYKLYWIFVAGFVVVISILASVGATTLIEGACK